MGTGERANSLVSRLRRFYQDNPDEELLYAEIVEKFNSTIWHVRDVVAELRREGLLESVHVVRCVTKGRFSAKAEP